MEVWKKQKDSIEIVSTMQLKNDNGSREMEVWYAQ